MPGRFTFGRPCWYALAIDPTAIGNSTSTVCHHGAIGSLEVSPDVVTMFDDIVSSLLNRSRLGG